MAKLQADLLNGAALAYLGDAAYETYIRHHVLASGKTSVNDLHRAAIKYVEAKGQAKVMMAWIKEESYLTDQEITIYKRGRNHKANTKAKNASIQDYRQATGFEALMGWLYLTNQVERLEDLIQAAINLIDQEDPA